MDADLLAQTLLSAPVLAFLLGALTVAVRSDLALPEQLSTSLSIYLLLAIGLKGGVALRESDPTQMIIPLAIGLALGVAIPVAAFRLLGAFTRIGVQERGAIAAHYGSTSLVTFLAALAALSALGIEVPGYAYALVAALEIPGIVVGLALAQRSSTRSSWPATMRELLAGTSIVLLVGGLALGAVIGTAGYEPIAPVFSDAFKGLLVLFLVGLGIKAAQGIRAIRAHMWGLVGFAIVFPIIVVSTVTTLGALIGLGVGGAVVLGVLCASASYIAAPAAVRICLPHVNLALPLAASLSVTFPINLIAGIPLSVTIARALN